MQTAPTTSRRSAAILRRSHATGVPIQIVAPAGGSRPKKEGRGENVEGALMVKNDSPIRDYADLAGRTVAVNTPGNVIDVTVNAALERHGVDHTTVERLEVPFPDTLTALDADRVDAAVLATPFKTMAERSGRYRATGFSVYDARPELIYIGYFVSSRLAEDNEEVLERFLSALRPDLDDLIRPGFCDGRGPMGDKGGSG